MQDVEKNEFIALHVASRTGGSVAAPAMHVLPPKTQRVLWPSSVSQSSSKNVTWNIRRKLFFVVLVRRLTSRTWCRTCRTWKRTENSHGGLGTRSSSRGGLHHRIMPGILITCGLVCTLEDEAVYVHFREGSERPWWRPSRCTALHPLLRVLLTFF